LSLGDIAALVWRERRLALGVGGAIMALGLAIALSQPRTYAAESRVLVRLGQEYVFEPQVGGAGAGMAPRTEEYISAELKLMTSPEVARRTIQRVGLAKLYPPIARNAAQAGPEMTLALAQNAFLRAFSATTAPNSQVIAMAFKHNDPRLAAETLNVMTEEYIAYRREILVDPATSAFEEQSAGFDVRAAEAAQALQAFLRENGVVDFEAELKSQSDLQSRLIVEVSEAGAKRREFEGQAAALRVRAKQEPQEIQLYAESDAGKRLVDLELEREQLLSRYQPNAAPVVEIDRRIAQVQAFLAGEERASLSRRGANPVHQDVAQNLFAAEVSARAQSAREAALVSQRQSSGERLRQLQVLEPEFRRLQRERLVLEENARAFAARAEQERARRDIAKVRTDNVRQMEKATPATQGSSLRVPIFLASALLAGLTAFAAALGRGLLRPGFPTAGSVARTLDLPVIGVIPKTPAARRVAEAAS
jgi:uncharacterized protein involved in exopolysaccharide biosynthesis